jgi:hypothetical protein
MLCLRNVRSTMYITQLFFLKPWDCNINVNHYIDFISWACECEQEKSFVKYSSKYSLTHSHDVDGLLWHVPRCCHVKRIFKYSFIRTKILTWQPRHNVHVKCSNYLHNLRIFIYFRVCLNDEVTTQKKPLKNFKHLCFNEVVISTYFNM